MAQVPEDGICTECGDDNLDTEACYNQGDVCVYCCGRLYPEACCGEPTEEGETT